MASVSLLDMKPLGLRTEKRCMYQDESSPTDDGNTFHYTLFSLVKWRVIILNQKAQSMTFLANSENFALYSKEETEPSDIEERNYYFSGGARTGNLR